MLFFLFNLSRFAEFSDDYYYINTVGENYLAVSTFYLSTRVWITQNLKYTCQLKGESALTDDLFV